MRKRRDESFVTNLIFVLMTSLELEEIVSKDYQGYRLFVLATSGPRLSSQLTPLIRRFKLLRQYGNDQVV